MSYSVPHGEYLITAQQDPFSLGAALYIARRDHSGDIFQLTNITVTDEKIEPGNPPKNPSLRLTDGQAQMVLQALWNMGYRPNKGESGIAHVDALKYHLEDMRRLVFKEQAPSAREAGK